MTSFPRASGSFLMPHPLLSSHIAPCIAIDILYRKRGLLVAMRFLSAADVRLLLSPLLLIGKESLMDAVSFLSFSFSSSIY